MDLICPDCRGALQMTSPSLAVCSLHGGHFEVLFDRCAEPSAALPISASLPVACAAHPRQKAVADCGSCAKPICALCSLDWNGRPYCADCAAAQASAQRAAAPAVQNPSGLLTLNLTSSAPPQTRRERVGVVKMCADHPENPGVADCRLCGKPVCATCDFALPGGVHLCPRCVENSQSSDEVSPKRKRLSYIAVALAAWSTVLTVMLLVGAFNSMLNDPDTGKAADLVITNLILWPLLVGAGLAMSAKDRRLKSTGVMKLAVWWNGVLGVIVLLFVVAANLGLIG